MLVVAGALVDIAVAFVDVVVNALALMARATPLQLKRRSGADSASLN